MRIGFKNFHQLMAYLWLMISNLPMSRGIRWHIVKMAGVKFIPPSNPKDRRVYFIGKNVSWDGVYPEKIEIGNNAHIASGCVILSHYLTIDHRGWVIYKHGEVKLGEHAYLGTNVIVTKPVTIGHHAIVGAGSVVTKDIPPCEIWGGVPAKLIRKYEITEEE